MCRVVVLRRRLTGTVALTRADDGQGDLFWADAENAFDELKNQWGWGGFTTHDLKRHQHMAQLIALTW